MARRRLTIAVPASVISDTPHLREKTAKIGYISRASAIFRVDEIIVYADNLKAKQDRDLSFVSLLLNYLETPQYLRKRLFELKRELQFAGILPPLRIPSHPQHGHMKDLKIGEYREGVVISKTQDSELVDIGVEQPANLNDTGDSFGQRITLKIVKINSRNVETVKVPRSEIPTYWGYQVSIEKRSLRDIIENRKFDLTLGTSKLADRFQDVSSALASRWHKAKNVLVLFGAPAKGLFEIADEQGSNLEAIVDFVMNMISEQGTETVRSEEAILATLAILNEHFAS